MNKTIRLIQNHRSIRKFTAQPIEEELLQDLLLAGQAAATSSFIQATTVIRVRDAGLKEQFVELSGGQKYIADAAEFLVFCADLQRNKKRVDALGAQAEFAWTEQFLTASLDVGLFAQNVVIAAESAGLGICYIGGIRNDPERVNKLLELPDLVYPVFGLCLGYPAQNPERKPRLPLPAIVFDDRYRQSDDVDSKIDAYDEQVQRYYITRSGGKLDMTWSEQMKKQAATQSRPFMFDFLRKKGFIAR